MTSAEIFFNKFPFQTVGWKFVTHVQEGSRKAFGIRTNRPDILIELF